MHTYLLTYLFTYLLTAVKNRAALPAGDPSKLVGIIEDNRSKIVWPP